MENGGNRTSTGSSSNGGGSNASNVPLHPTEHQIYATIQRKQPPFPPFGGGGVGGVGGDPIEGVKEGVHTVQHTLQMMMGSGMKLHHNKNKVLLACLLGALCIVLGFAFGYIWLSGRPGCLTDYWYQVFVGSDVLGVET